MKVIIVDDHELIREGLQKVLAKQPDINVIAEASNTGELFSHLYEKTPDVIILDITMPGRSGLDVLKDIKTISPSAKILVLSMHPEERFAMRAIKAGASGYLTKQSAAKELVNAVRKVAGGGRYISSNFAEHLAFEIHTSDKQLHETLSSREFEIMRLISLGKSAGDIAKDLNLSINTVTSYRSRLMEKMNMKSNAEIARYAVENQLVE